MTVSRYALRNVIACKIIPFNPNDVITPLSVMLLVYKQTPKNVYNYSPQVTSPLVIPYSLPVARCVYGYYGSLHVMSAQCAEFLYSSIQQYCWYMYM